MRCVNPKVFLIAEPVLADYYGGVGSYLEHISADWSTDAKTDAEALVEVMGRLCYRSFEPGLNPNVTKVREGNKAHLSNIIAVGHGSVLEHAQVSFIFADVSRVFTHELVRHRVGTAISQESLRFVRLTDLGLWLPPEIEQDPQVRQLFEKTFKDLEDLQKQLAVILDLDNKPFAEKKKLTSAMRRVAPIGLATTIGWSANFRTLRHVIEMRTSRHAEHEIRVVFSEVASILCKRYPAVFGDYVAEDIDGVAEYKTEYSKI